MSKITSDDLTTKAALLQVDYDIKYKGYVDIEMRRVEKIKSLESAKIPLSFDYKKLKNFSTEALEKLLLVRPETIGQASRIDGVKSSDVSILCIAIKNLNR